MALSENSLLRRGGRNGASIAKFRTRRPAHICETSRYAFETDWPVGAAGFEPLHLEIRSAELHPASTGFRRRSGAPLIRDAQVRVPPPGLRVLANSDSNMQRFESRQEVLALVAGGLLNKQIAAEIGLAEITVKIHRGHLMKKMGAKSLADLVRMAEILGVRRPKP